MDTNKDQLRDGLELAAIKFHESEIVGALAALDTVTTFLEAEGIASHGARMPLLWLAMRLADEALQKPGKAQFDAVRMGIAAGLVDLLNREGISLPQAAKMMAKRAGGFTAPQLLEFRKNLGKGRAQPVAVEMRRRTANDLAPYLKETADKDIRVKAILAATDNLFCSPN